MIDCVLKFWKVSRLFSEIAVWLLCAGDVMCDVIRWVMSSVEHARMSSSSSCDESPITKTNNTASKHGKRTSLQLLFPITYNFLCSLPLAMCSRTRTSQVAGFIITLSKLLADSVPNPTQPPTVNPYGLWVKSLYKITCLYSTCWLMRWWYVCLLHRG